MQIVHGGEDAFSAAISGVQSNASINHWAEQMAQVKALMGNVYDDAANAFIARAETVFNKFNNSRAIELAKAAINQISGLFQQDIVRDIVRLQDFQIATPIMQRYIMAEPTIRQMYHKQMCDGYSDTYVDQYPDLIGENHPDWRRVMDGAYVEKDNEYYFSCYADNAPDQTQLTSYDQMRIRRTWDNLKSLILSGTKDPTSAWNNDL